MLKLNMDPAFEVEIDGKHAAFTGTPFAGADFKVKVRPQDRTAIAALHRKFSTTSGGRTVVDEAGVSQELFVRSVVSWEGIVDQDGKPLVCDDPGKRIVARVHWAFASIITQVAMESQVDRDTAKADEVGN